MDSAARISSLRFIHVEISQKNPGPVSSNFVGRETLRTWEVVRREKTGVSWLWEISVSYSTGCQYFIHIIISWAGRDLRVQQVILVFPREREGRILATSSSCHCDDRYVSWNIYDTYIRSITTRDFIDLGLLIRDFGYRISCRTTHMSVQRDDDVRSVRSIKMIQFIGEIVTMVGTVNR